MKTFLEWVEAGQASPPPDPQTFGIDFRFAVDALGHAVADSIMRPRPYNKFGPEMVIQTLKGLTTTPQTRPIVHRIIQRVNSQPVFMNQLTQHFQGPGFKNQMQKWGMVPPQ